MRTAIRLASSVSLPLHSGYRRQRVTISNSLLLSSSCCFSTTSIRRSTDPSAAAPSYDPAVLPRGPCPEDSTKACCQSKAPIKVTVKKGVKVAWCSCGKTNKPPFCDGSHKQYNRECGSSNNQQETQFRSVHFIPQEDGEVWFCNCKRTKNQPFCDGAHKDC